MKVHVAGDSLHLYDIDTRGIEIELSESELEEFKAVSKRFFELQDLIDDRVDETFRRERETPR